MKKNYFAPEMKVVKIKARHNLLISSVEMYGKNAGGTAMSREFDDDFDDFDE